MMKGKNKRCVAMLTACSILLCGCSVGGKKEEQPKETAQVSESTQKENLIETMDLKIGFSTDENDPRVESSVIFKEEVEEKTKGRITVTLCPNGEMGSDAELIKGIILGTVDMTVSSAGNFANYADKVGVSAFPFLFSDFEEAWEFMDSELEATLEEELEAYNIKVLAHFDNGFRCVTTSEKVGAVNSVKDMENLKIRTPENQIVMETMAELGANPHILDFTELYGALKKGEFDAQENPIPIIYNHKFYKVQSYLAVTNHSYDAMPFVIRKDIWDGFSEADQKVIKAAAQKAQEVNRQAIRQQTEEYVQKLEDKGMTVTYPDLAEFKEETRSVYDYFASSYGEELMNQLKE